MSGPTTMTQVSASARLRAVLALGLPALGATGRRLWSSPDLAALYPGYMMAMHHITRASVSLMAEAAQALRRRAATPAADPADGLVIAYLERHIPEEDGHDEWVLEDLERLGIARETVLAAHPYPAAAALVGTQYYYIRHHDPIALLGYIAQLEGNPPHEAALLAAAERSGLPVAAFRTLRKHANLDPYHRRDLDQLLDELPPDRHRDGLILCSALDAAVMAVSLIDQVCAGPPPLRPGA
jgi:Iron-containing redox enzyme